MISLVEFVVSTLITVKSKIEAMEKLPKIHIVAPVNVIAKLQINRDHILYQCMEFFTKFARSSSIHGMNRIVNKEKTPIEKIFWAMVTLVSTIFCLILVFDTVKHTKLSPIEFGIDEKIWTLNDVSFLDVVLLLYL